MGKLRWYKRDPDAALGGMMALTLEERGAYNTVLDLIYSRADELPDDDRFLAGWCNCDLRVWRRIKTRLITLGKLHVEAGMLRNLRATSGVTEALSRVASATEAANIKHANARAAAKKNNDLGRAPASKTHMHSTTTTRPTPPTEDVGAREARPPPTPRLVKFALTDDWQPLASTIETLCSKGYSDHEIAWQRDRFVNHFSGGEKRPGWDRSFLNWVTRDPPGKHDPARNGAGNRPSRTSLVAGVGRLLDSMPDDEPLRG